MAGNDTKEKRYKKIIKDNLFNTIESGFIPELGEHKSGKVRDVHFTGKKVGDPIVMVASDRVSSFDFILNRLIPFKGRVLNMFAKWAFENSKDIVPNAMIDSPHDNVIIQKYCKNLMVECVVRGYNWGSLAGEYESGQRDFYGEKLPDGLLRYQKLKKPFFTPTTKADAHDLPMTFAEVEKQVGKAMAKKIKETSIKLYIRASALAAKQGFVFIDTKYEFGLDAKGNIVLIDEANTPDSSRYCSTEEYKKFETIKKEMKTGKYKDVSELLGKKPKLKIKELSKQFVRDVLVSKGFGYGSEGEPPELSDEDVIEVAYRYINLYETVTGNDFVFPHGDVKQGMISQLIRNNYIKGGLAVIMAGSDSDMPHIEKIRGELKKYGIGVQVRICSAHKQPADCERIVKEYNSSLEPVVIIGVAGGTDALSGVASFHSVHPVISCPPNPAEYESCVKNPPGSSNSLILKPANASRHAAKMLGNYVAVVRETIVRDNEKKIQKLKDADRKARQIN